MTALFHKGVMMHAKTLWTLAFVVVVQTGVPFAWAKKPAPARQAPGTLKFVPAPSDESPAARERRLRRECKGRPDAGACLGLTGR